MLIINETRANDRDTDKQQQAGVTELHMWGLGFFLNFVLSFVNLHKRSD